MKKPIEIYIRTRPTDNFAHNNIKIEEEKGLIKITIPKKKEDGIINHQQENWEFNFDKILLNESQEFVYDLTARKSVDAVIHGISSSVIAFGQTGAGKTFTTIGLNNDYRYRGLVPRTISDMFKQLSKQHDISYKVSINYIEIYNENIHDLLDPMLNSNISLQEDPAYGILPKGSSIVTVSNEEEALELMFQGQTNRTICEHKLNKNSSRSHAIFTIILEARSKVESSEKVIVSKLQIVDLAGSERTKKTNSQGETLLEASFINKSLSYLEQLVVAFNEKTRDCLPYRQSKLTYLLKDSIGGNCSSVIIANIWPESNHLEETISTLKFAQRMKLVSNAPIQRIKLDSDALLKKYEKQVKDLKMELAMHDTLSGRGRISYEVYTPEQQNIQQQLAQKYLDAEIDDIDIESLRQVKELFGQFRNIYRNLVLSTENERNMSKKSLQQMLSKHSMQKQNSDEQNSNQVGEQEYVNGFGFGKAPKQSVPTNRKPKDNKENEQKIPNSRMEKQSSLVQQIENSQSDMDVNSQNKILEKQSLFEYFKDNQGRDLVLNLKDTLEIVKQNKSYFDEDKINCQKLKQEIDKLQINLKNQLPEDLNSDDISDENLALVNELKNLKKKYKMEYENYVYHKKMIKDNEKKSNELKKKLIEEFNMMLKQEYNISLSNLNNQQQRDCLMSEKNILNSAEEIFESALKKFRTTVRAKKFDKIYDSSNQ